MGGVLAFRDKGLFWQKFSEFNEDGSVKTDIGHTLKFVRYQLTVMILTAECRDMISWLFARVCMKRQDLIIRMKE